ncbi:MAG: SCO family protein, partial [Prosthecobacter sp.]|nr:SCO family protein [Prosthecobacter sp.]
RSQVSRSLADENYLSHWAGDLDLGPEAEALRQAPVTHVSWFAAKAYCEALGKRLPTQDEWESAARADLTRIDASSDPAFLRQVLEWYATPATRILAAVNTTPLNVHGVRGLHGLVWEWVHDFNSSMIVGDGRSDGTLERQLFCGAGSLLAADVANYSAYMRYAFRSSLKGAYCVASLGFRATRSLQVPVTPNTRHGEWRTQDDRAVTLDKLRGKVQVLTMGFTRCQFACPRTLGDMQRIEKALGADADQVSFIFLSIDPTNDTPARMTQTLNERHLNPARWTFLTAPEALVQQTAVAYDFKYQLIDGFFAHSNLIAVLDASGEIVHREQTLDADIQPSVDAVRKLLRTP